MAAPEPEDNPYAAPLAAADPAPSDMQRVGLWEQIAWAVVFGVNLIVPVILALSSTHGGRAGIILAAILLFILSLRAIIRSERIWFALMSGGICVGLSQVMPILQIVAGLISLLVAKGISGIDLDPTNGKNVGLNEPIGFVVTLLTGGLLLLAALLCGQFIHWVSRARFRTSERSQ